MAKTAKMLKPTENRLAKKRAPPSKNAAIVRTVPSTKRKIVNPMIRDPTTNARKQNIGKLHIATTAMIKRVDPGFSCP